MPLTSVQSFLDELNVRFFSGDWRGYRRLVTDPSILVGDERSVIREGEADLRRGFDKLATRLAASGWDGYDVRAQDVLALGAASFFVISRAFPTVGEAAACEPYEEGYLLRLTDAGLRLFGLINPTSTRFWADQWDRPALLPGEDVAAEIERIIAALYDAVRRNDLGAWLGLVDFPFPFCFDAGIVPVRDAADAAELIGTTSAVARSFREFSIEPLSMARVGEALVAARFRVTVTMADGTRRDPFTNLYILRRSRHGWRLALLFSGSVGVLLPLPARMMRTAT